MVRRDTRDKNLIKIFSPKEKYNARHVLFVVIGKKEEFGDKYWLNNKCEKYASLIRYLSTICLLNELFAKVMNVFICRPVNLSRYFLSRSNCEDF